MLDHVTSPDPTAPHGFIVYADVFYIKEEKRVQGSLRRIPLGATSAYQTTLISTEYNLVALEYYHTDDFTGYIYFSDASHPFIGRVGFDGTGLRCVVDGVRTDSLAIDWISGNLYWIDYDIVLDEHGKLKEHVNFTIAVSRLDGSYKKTLISSGLGALRGLAVLPREGYVVLAANGVVWAELETRTRNWLAIH